MLQPHTSPQPTPAARSPDQISNPAVQVEDLAKHYGDVRALDGVSLQTAPGEIFGLLGHNGAGESTMIRILTGRAKPPERPRACPRSRSAARSGGGSRRHQPRRRGADGAVLRRDACTCGQPRGLRASDGPADSELQRDQQLWRVLHHAAARVAGAVFFVGSGVFMTILDFLPFSQAAKLLGDGLSSQTPFDTGPAAWAVIAVWAVLGYGILARIATRREI